MREFLDSILTFIQSESLTDEEFETIELEDESYSVETYLALRTILEARENVSDQVERLRTYFMARGVDVDATPDVPTPVSNILIGSPL